jgi:hypothetical protein
VALPERVPGFVVAAGRAVGHDLPSLDVRESLAPWREAIGGRGPFFVRLQADDPAAVAHVRRLAWIGELWLEAPLGSVEDALDLVVAGATRLVVPTLDRDPEMLDAIGPSSLIAWDGTGPWADVQAAALDHDVPVVARIAPPEEAACDVFLVKDGPEGFELARVASAPVPAAEAAEGEAE